MDEIIQTLKMWVTVNGINIILALLILVVGRWVAKLIRNVLQKILLRRQLEKIIVSFIASIVYVGLLVFVVIAALAKLGIQTASFVAVIGAAGLAIGLALQGSLANFAAGFLLIVFRPFKVGEYIEGAGTAGTVDELQIFTTTLITPDNKKVIIPNAKLTSDNIINYTAMGTRRIEWVFGVSYGDNLDKVRSQLQAILDKETRILKEPASMIAVKEMADSSVNFAVRAWVNVSDYWGVFFDTNEAVKKSFDAAKITIPFPQRDVHLYEHTKA
ncbi:MAG: mechanosensitive ion channel [Sedimentisphaerales bacterium]|nr:mechanosensitive ion channel [Sedimentisphaerales bacterium]